MICIPVNGLSPSQGLQTGSPPLSGSRPTPPLFPFGLRVRPSLPKTGGVGRSMVPAKPRPPRGGRTLGTIGADNGGGTGSTSPLPHGTGHASRPAPSGTGEPNPPALQAGGNHPPTPSPLAPTGPLRPEPFARTTEHRSPKRSHSAQDAPRGRFQPERASNSPRYAKRRRGPVLRRSGDARLSAIHSRFPPRPIRFRVRFGKQTKRGGALPFQSRISRNPMQDIY